MFVIKATNAGVMLQYLPHTICPSNMPYFMIAVNGNGNNKKVVLAKKKHQNPKKSSSSSCSKTQIIACYYTLGFGQIKNEKSYLS